MSNEDSGRTNESELPSPGYSLPIADDEHETLDLPSLPPIDFGTLADLPEFQTNVPPLENATPINFSLQGNLLPDAPWQAQAAIDDMQREVRDLRHTIFILEQRLNVYDCILPQLQQEYEVFSFLSRKLR
jgi:hypothetical protein